MRRSFLYSVTGAVFVAAMLSPLLGLNAAEIWNSQSRDTKKKSTLYNTPKDSKIGKGPTTIYNRQSNPGIETANDGGLRLKLEAYQNIQKVQQHPSKLWPLLSPQALENKQTDIDIALENGYKRQLESAKSVTKMLKEDAVLIAKAEIEHQERVAAYFEARARKEEERWLKKERAVYGTESESVSKRYTATSSARSSAESELSESQSISSANKRNSGPIENKQILKKPKRLFNDPNR